MILAPATFPPSRVGKQRWLGGFAAAMMLCGSASAQDAAGDKSRAPMPREPQNWMSDDDYPAVALRRKETGTTDFKLDIDAKGKIVACHVTGSSGFWELDEGSCAVMMKNSKFYPALNAKGDPIASEYRSKFTWTVPGQPRRISALTAEQRGILQRLDLEVERLPASYGQPAIVRLRFVGAGSAKCRIEETSGDARIDAAACAQARQLVPRPPATPDGMHPDASVAVVSFQKAGGK